MPRNNEIEKLVEILQTQTKSYSDKQIKSAILAEGYSEEIANAVVEKLYPARQQQEALATKQKEFILANETTNTKQKDTVKIEEQRYRGRREAKELTTKEPATINKEEKNHFKEVDYLIGELKNLGDVKAPDIGTPELFSEQERKQNGLSSVSKDNIETQIAAKKEQIAKIKITAEDEEKVQTDKGKIINLKDFPRRDWHIYKDKGKTIAEIKNEEINKIKNEINELRRSSHGSGQREDMQESSSERMREKHKEKEIEREYESTAAENIYTQMKKNPNIYGPEDEDKKKNEKEGEEIKEERKRPTAKKQETEMQEAEPEFNLESETQDLNSVDLNHNLEEEFNLNLNLDETPVKGKDKKKK